MGTTRFTGAVSTLALLLALALSTLTADPAGAADPLWWGSPSRIDNQAPYGNGASISAPSCPTTSFCAAVDTAGNLVSSNDPGGGAGAWRVTQVSADPYLGRISCPSASLCVATSMSGHVEASANPLGVGPPGPTTTSPIRISRPVSRARRRRCASS